MNHRLGVLAVIVFGATLAGCDAVPPEYEKQWIRLQKEWDALLTVLTGGRSPLAGASPKPAAGASPGEEPVLTSENARNAKANAELLQEVYRVVYLRDPKDRSEFGSLVDTLNQGASFEGVYNGFAHSSEYRKLEMANPGASVEALKAFGEELAWLEAELPAPVEFDVAATRPLALPVQPGVDPVAAPPAPSKTQAPDGINVIEYGKPAPSASPVDVARLAEKYGKQFVGASIFTLKRVLGDEALRVMTVKREYPEKMAHWYSLQAVRLAGRKVDFGIPLRNQPDERFHYNWALKASEDRVKWEVLNRLHRVLNEANRPKQ